MATAQHKAAASKAKPAVTKPPKAKTPAKAKPEASKPKAPAKASKPKDKSIGKESDNNETKPGETNGVKVNFPVSSFGRRATDTQPTLEQKEEANHTYGPTTSPATSVAEAVVNAALAEANKTEAFLDEVAALAAKHGLANPTNFTSLHPQAQPPVSIAPPGLNNHNQPTVTSDGRGRRAHEQQNGISRPNAHTLCGKIWAAADELTTPNAPATISALRAHANVKGVNEHTIKTQYARWRQFHGVHGRQQVTQTLTPQAPNPATANSMPQAAETAVAQYGRRAEDKAFQQMVNEQEQPLNRRAEDKE